jgi:hypothetical protein
MDPQINSTLNVHPGSGSGRTSPTGEENQGPSLMDYSIELEAEFPKEMILEMKGNAARKTRRTVIGRTLGGRASFKMLQECLKLHLPEIFALVTLLTRGFFLILFENEEGATATRKLAVVEWSGPVYPFPGTIQTSMLTFKERKRSLRTLSRFSFPICMISSEMKELSPSWRASSEKFWT